jgi:hypothetical protein
VARRGGSFRDPLEQVTGLAVEHPAHGWQRIERQPFIEKQLLAPDFGRISTVRA